MSAPSELPRWATAGGAQITHPSSGFQDLGYEPNTPAGAGVRNWLDNLAYQWINWLNGQDVANTAAHATLTADALALQTRVQAHHEINGALKLVEPVTVFSSPNSITGVESNGAGRIVAVGLGGNIATSDDLGTTWTARTSGTAFALNDVYWEFGSSLFVACGDLGAIRTSPDGVTWTPRTSGVTDTLSLMAAGPSSTILVGGDQGQVIYSTNITSGYTAAPISGATGVVTSFNVFGTRITVTVTGGSTTRDTCVYTTTNMGATWTPVTLGVLSSTQRIVDIKALSTVLHGLVVDTVSGAKSFVSSADHGLTWTIEGGPSLDSATDYVFERGAAALLIVGTELDKRGAAFDGGWHPLFQRGFGRIARLRLLGLDAGGLSSSVGTKVWVGLGHNGTADDRGKACFSMPFTL